MSVSVSLSESRAFGREALIVIGGGAVSGIVAAGLELIAGAGAPQLMAISFGAVVGLVANFADHKIDTPVLRLLLSIAGGFAAALLWTLNPILAGAAAGLLLGGAFALGEDHSGPERAAAISVYGFWMAAAVFVTHTFAVALEMAVVGHVFTGAVWGLFLAFAGGLRRLEWRRDEVIASFREAEADLKGELKRSVEGGRVLYEQILQEVERVPAKDRDRAEEIATETSQALIALCRRSDELGRAAERTSQRKLQMRVLSLDERIANTTDATVRRELEATLDELLEQVKVRRRFDLALARLEARQQRCFTALERLHVSLIQSASGGPGDDAAVLESIASLEKLSDEIRWRNLSVEELCEGEEGVEVDEEDSDELIAEIRAEMDGAAESSDDVEEVEFPTREESVEEPETPTVLDSAAFADEVDGSTADPPGTDGSLESTVEHVEVATAEHSG